MNTKIGHCNLKPFVTLNCEDLEFSSEGVSVASCQISMIRHETGSCYNSAMQCPMCTKIPMFDKTPDLKRSTLKKMIFALCSMSLIKMSSYNITLGKNGPNLILLNINNLI